MKLLHKITREVERLSYLELVKLDEVIHRLLDKQLVKEPEIRDHPDREVVERKRVGNITYQLERVRCGKPNCKCAKGSLRGPYWFTLANNAKIQSERLAMIARFLFRLSVIQYKLYEPYKPFI